MTDVATPSRYNSTKKHRSQSICAATSLEQLPPSTGGTSGESSGTPQASRRRRPATRSQSARLTGNRSVRRRPTLVPKEKTAGGGLYSSEPKLDQVTPEVSPHIKRKGSTRRGTSVYHRKSAAFLDVPDLRGSHHSTGNGSAKTGTAAAQGDEEDEDSYRLRSFSFTSKGIVNRGDSFRRRRSRSNSLCPGPNGTALPPGGEDPNQQPPSDVISYTVALLGAHGVGKTALISQFLTSECINAYDRQKDSFNTESVSIMLNGEESELVFLNISNPKEMDRTNPPDAFVIVYSVVDKASFLKAEGEIGRLQDADLLRTRPAILVGNKIDLARSRAVSTQDGKCLACTFRSKFVEVSVGINHNVDELLVGILTQIRLKSFHNEELGLHHQRHQNYASNYTTGGNGTVAQQHHWYKSRGVVRASMKARQMFTWLFGKEDSKFKNCENLHIL